MPKFENLEMDQVLNMIQNESRNRLLRWFVYFGLLVGVYLDSVIATTLSIALVFISLEVHNGAHWKVVRREFDEVHIHDRLVVGEKRDQ